MASLSIEERCHEIIPALGTTYHHCCRLFAYADLRPAIIGERQIRF
jgi:hypothetical protein